MRKQGLIRQRFCIKSDTTSKEWNKAFRKIKKKQNKTRKQASHAESNNGALSSKSNTGYQKERWGRGIVAYVGRHGRKPR